jgi:D-inositol-3-phosphate glycosyltransferase
VGRIEPLKGIDTLIRAMGLLLERHTGWQDRVALAIVGGIPDDSPAVRSEEQERLRALRAELRLTDFVAFLGAKSQDTLPYYYSAADVVVVPSLYEPFGIVALEAAIAGAPLVVAETGGLRDLAEAGVAAASFPAGDAEALADAVGKLLVDPAAARRAAQRAARLVRREHTWQRVAARTAEVYRRAAVTASAGP